MEETGLDYNQSTCAGNGMFKIKKNFCSLNFPSSIFSNYAALYRSANITVKHPMFANFRNSKNAIEGKIQTHELTQFNGQHGKI